MFVAFYLVEGHNHRIGVGAYQFLWYGKFWFLYTYKFDPLNHAHVCHVSPQLSCGGTCQTWRWYSTSIFLILKMSVINGTGYCLITLILKSSVINVKPWWRHQMETFSALLAICAGNSPVPGEFPAQRPVTRSFDVFFDLCPNKRLSKQSWGWWFETLSCSLWRHCNGVHKASNNQDMAPWREWWYPVASPATRLLHSSDVIMGAMASLITSLTIVFSTFYSGVDQRKHQCSASLAFVLGINRWNGQ